MLVHALLVFAAWMAAPGTDAVSLRVVTGRAELATADGVRTLTPSSGAVELSDPTYAEAGALSELELRWSGVASAEIEGPAALEVGPGERLHLVRFHRAEVEVRRGSLTLLVGEACVLELSGGAVSLRELPEGGLELRNRGGRALRVRLSGSSRERTLEPGETVRLRRRAPAA